MVDNNLSRRDVIKYGAAGFACSFYAVSANALEQDETIFSKDDAYWSKWEARGWIKETKYYIKRGNNIVQCKTCPNMCILGLDERSLCRSKINKNGKLYTLAYGNPCSANNDPIEKKPLYHFLPETNIFSIAASGCGFRCLNCQNWSISQARPEEVKDPTGEPVLLTPMRKKPLTLKDMHRLSMFPKNVVAMAQHLKLPSIAYTYSEPSTWFEYMSDTAKLAREKGIKNVWITCGYINEKPLIELCKYIDAANVDLKSFSNETYMKLNSGRLEPVLDTLKTLKKQGVWFEITNLIVPTYTDNLDEISKMCDWIAENLGTDYPLHFSRFHPAFRLKHLPRTPVDVMIKASEIARKAGLNYVYIGNVPELEDAGITFCPKCKTEVIKRQGYSIIFNKLKNGLCPKCSTKIAGVWN